MLSPTYRAMHDDVLAGKIGRVLLARARYGWAGPWWGQWYLPAGGGALFDLAIYNLLSLCGFMGPVRRVCAMVGTAIPRRMAEGVEIDVQADDNAQVLLDFGDSRFACITTGFTMQKYRSPAVELYGTDGVLQLLGDDWAPQGFERWTREREVWELARGESSRIGRGPPACGTSSIASPPERGPSTGLSTPCTAWRSCWRPRPRPGKGDS